MYSKCSVPSWRSLLVHAFTAGTGPSARRFWRWWATRASSVSWWGSTWATAKLGSPVGVAGWGCEDLGEIEDVVWTLDRGSFDGFMHLFSNERDLFYILVMIYFASSRKQQYKITHGFQPPKALKKKTQKTHPFLPHFWAKIHPFHRCFQAPKGNSLVRPGPCGRLRATSERWGCQRRDGERAARGSSWPWGIPHIIMTIIIIHNHTIFLYIFLYIFLPSLGIPPPCIIIPYTSCNQKRVYIMLIPSSYPWWQKNA